jgi:hypothetical protein
MIAGDNDTDAKFFAVINNTGEQLSLETTALAINLLPASTTPSNNDRRHKDTGDKFFADINDTGEQLLPVTTTPAITFFPCVVDTDHK